jgi:hypothetical protein
VSVARVDRAGDRVRFVAGDGTVFTVWDVSFSGGRHHRHPYTSGRATSRVFVPEAGSRRLHRFKPGESRALEPELLAQQLRSAEYLPTEPPGQTVRDPR